MIFPTKDIILKDGRKAVLRNPGEDDAAAMIEFMRTCAAETDFILRYPEECTMTEQQEAAFIERSNAYPLRCDDNMRNRRGYSGHMQYIL